MQGPNKICRTLVCHSHHSLPHLPQVTVSSEWRDRRGRIHFNFEALGFGFCNPIGTTCHANPSLRFHFRSISTISEAALWKAQSKSPLLQYLDVSGFVSVSHILWSHSRSHLALLVWRHRDTKLYLSSCPHAADEAIRTSHELHLQMDSNVHLESGMPCSLGSCPSLMVSRTKSPLVSSSSSV